MTTSGILLALAVFGFRLNLRLTASNPADLCLFSQSVYIIMTLMRQPAPRRDRCLYLGNLTADRTAAIASCSRLALSPRGAWGVTRLNSQHSTSCHWDTTATEVIMHYEPVGVESRGSRRHSRRGFEEEHVP